MINILIVLIAYFLGNISGSLIFDKILYGIDIRNMGSGNAGATNATRSVGDALLPGARSDAAL